MATGMTIFQGMDFPGGGGGAAGISLNSFILTSDEFSIVTHLTQ
jgi:hypothetical protein